MKLPVFFLTLVMGALGVQGAVNPASPIFSARNSTHVASLDHVGIEYMGLKTIDGGFSYPTATQVTNSNAPLQAPPQEPVSVDLTSGCALSFCAGSACVGSYCFGSACGGSACMGSGCTASGCASSACLGSACAGSGCGGSICFASACGGSACIGSACLGNCGPPPPPPPPKPGSFPLVNACDYRIKSDQIVLSLSTSAATRLCGARITTDLAPNQVNEFTIPGHYHSVSFSKDKTDSLVITLTSTEGMISHYILIES